MVGTDGVRALDARDGDEGRSRQATPGPEGRPQRERTPAGGNDPFGTIVSRASHVRARTRRASQRVATQRSRCARSDARSARASQPSRCAHATDAAAAAGSGLGESVAVDPVISRESFTALCTSLASRHTRVAGAADTICRAREDFVDDAVIADDLERLAPTKAQVAEACASGERLLAASCSELPVPESVSPAPRDAARRSPRLSISRTKACRIDASRRAASVGAVRGTLARPRPSDACSRAIRRSTGCEACRTGRRPTCLDRRGESRRRVAERSLVLRNRNERAALSGRRS
jgi:hypothetical protein